MHDILHEWATLMAVFMIAAITPGADLAIVIRQSLVFGRRHAMMTSFGIGSALLVHVTYTVLGLGIIITQSLLLFNIVKWLGVAYLFYIGLKALTSNGTMLLVENNDKKKLVKAKQAQSLKSAYMIGFVVNVLNPKAVFFFLSIFSTLVNVSTPTTMKLGYGLSMSVLLIIWFVMVSLFMTAPMMRAAFNRASKWIDRLCGFVFIGFGIRLIFQKAT
ncbi:LysE family translocator [Bartonella tamiae]|uniref:Homoserine/Threonine efflux protein n=1 Tax=Bartonella tamiae Th239 TaxID=1094558 RepID=J1K393_9HYPH|nr:LysE family translocator [Bartonella tamiae]EJF91595.1 homoserine/Threonine efflux protein [Bartonella tamiae Th239]EJF92421.1 homoserine/Threonine efflux protein [Bartonella tamiae Th307]